MALRTLFAVLRGENRELVCPPRDNQNLLRQGSKGIGNAAGLLALSAILLLWVAPLRGQEQTFTDVQELREETQRLNDQIGSLKKSTARLTRQTDYQSRRIQRLENRAQLREEGLQRDLSELKRQNRTGYETLGRVLDRRTLYWLLALVLATLVGSVPMVLLWKRQKVGSMKVQDQIKATRASFEGESLKLDGKLVEILENQLKILNAERLDAPPPASEVDHSLGLRVGEEIHRMRKRIENMPEDTKGIGALKNSLMRLEEEFKKQGYEIVDLLGRPYVDGLTVNARFVPSDTLKLGEQVITRVVTPQINHKGILQKAAEIEVSFGGEI